MFILLHHILGQFGRVYLAQLRSEKGPEGRKVAVKTLKCEFNHFSIDFCGPRTGVCVCINVCSFRVYA